MRADRAGIIDAQYMELALAEARVALGEGEFPFGAALVDSAGTVVAVAHDTVEADGDYTSHAETMLVKRACRVSGRRDLTGCTLYTTVEPCPMCFTTSWLARVSRIVWGATMRDVAEATRDAVRELAVPAVRMNELGGGAVALCGGVRRDDCLALFAGLTQAAGVGG